MSPSGLPLPSELRDGFCLFLNQKVEDELAQLQLPERLLASKDGRLPVRQPWSPPLPSQEQH